MKSKLIDIICPIYNQEKHINKFLLSLFNLDFDNINIILVDDGSTDRTASIINEVMSENVDKAFFYYKKNNGGAASARNYGMLHACSKYIWFCDPDDEVVGDLNPIFNILNESNADIYFFNYIHYFEKNGYEFKRRTIMYGKYDIESVKDRLIQHRLNVGGELNSFLIYPWDKIIKRSVIVNPFNEKLSVYEDQLFNFELIFSPYVKKVEFIDSEIYKYKTYLGNSSLSTSWTENKTSDFCFFINELILKFNLKPRALFKREVFYIMKKIGGVAAFKTYIYTHKQLGYDIFPLGTKNEIFKLFLISLHLYSNIIMLRDTFKS